MKILLILSFLLTSSIDSFSQFTLSDLTSYVLLDYDDLDDKLSKHNYVFKEEMRDDEKSQQYYWWTNKKNGNSFCIVVRQDTVSLKSDGVYTGYTNVNRFGLNLITYNQVQYNSILAEIKSLKLKKLSSKIEGSSIKTKYENDDFVLELIKMNSNNNIIYFVKVTDKAYEILSSNIYGQKVELKHSEKRMQPIEH